MVKLKIDPEFRDKIPALTEAEFDQLRDNILSDGEVYEPLVTWNGTIVDGHNRWRIIQEHPEIPYKVKEMDFADKWEAFEWMYRKQLGRRNLSDEQKNELVGKMSLARKQRRGNNAQRGVDGKYLSAHGEHTGRTSEQIAKELGIGKETVKRAEKFALGMEAVEKEFPETANQIRQGGYGVSQKFIASIPAMPDEQKIEAIEAVKSGPEAVAKFKKNATMEECNATPIIHEEAYNAKDFSDQVSGFPKEFDDLVRLFLMVHGDMLDIPECATAFERMLTDTEKIIEHYKEVLNEHRN